MNKSIITSLLIGLMSMIGINVSAHDIEMKNADGKTIYYNWMYTGTGSVLEVSYRDKNYGGNCYTGDIDIPESITYNGKDYKVTAIGENAFRDCSSLTSVVIPNSVTTIDGSAFNGCSNLISVNIPDGVTSIGTYTFYGCCGLTSVIIPNSVTEIRLKAFYGCTSLTSITIPNSVTTIGEEAFKNCSGLTSVIIPNRVTSIGNYAFSGCRGLSSIYVLGSPSKIGYSIFENCDNIKDVIFDCKTVTSILNGLKSPQYITLRIILKEGVETINSWAFSGLTNLSCITIPNSVTAIGERAFDDCCSLTSVIIPNSVTKLGDYVFAGCSSLISVTIGNNVPSIYSGTFLGCKGLTSLTIGSKVTYIGSNISTDTNLKKVIWLTNTPPTGYENVKGDINYVKDNQYSLLKNTVVYEFLSSLFEVNGIKYVPVTLSDYVCDAIDCVYDESSADTKISSSFNYENETMNVRFIQPYLAYNNIFINSLALDNDGEIPTCAFANCNKIKSVTLGDKLNSIGSFAFYNCKYLNTVSLGNNITSIGYSAFNNCLSLGYIAIPDAVKLIGEYAFSNCTSLVSATIGDGITSIGEYAFNNCTSLISAVMGDGGGTINDYAFNGCSSLKDLTIGTKVKEIKNYVFQNCKVLSQIIIPKFVTSIGNNVFSGCSGLKDVIIADREEILSLGRNGSSSLFCDCPLDSVYIGGDIDYNTSSSYGYSPFYRNTSLRTVVFTDVETEISEKEFYCCTNLRIVRIGDGVKSIGSFAFSGCSGLDYFSFGSCVESIGQKAFSDCSNVKKIISRATIPPICSINALDDINKLNCTLFVPVSNVEAYLSADQWKDFIHIVTNEDEKEHIIGDVNGDRFLNVEDIVSLVSYILGIFPSIYNEKTVDLNDDGVVNAADVVKLVNIISGQ